MSQVICIKCRKACKSLQGWKMHMSGAHGGYDSADLTQITGESAPDTLPAKMNALADSLPVDPSLFPNQPSDSSTGATPQPVPAPTPPPEKRIKATPKKLKRILGDIPSKILESNGIESDDDDREGLDEAAEFMAGIFGVEFSIPESKYVIESRFVGLLWVVGIMCLVWAKHKTPDIMKLFSLQKGQNSNAEKKSKTPDNKPFDNI
jgi:hypothetical protein